VENHLEELLTEAEEACLTAVAHVGHYNSSDREREASAKVIAAFQKIRKRSVENHQTLIEDFSSWTRRNKWFQFYEATDGFATQYRYILPNGKLVSVFATNGLITEIRSVY